MHRITALGLLLAVASAQAENPVYRIQDEQGRVTYSDRPAAKSSARVKMSGPLTPSRQEYDAAVFRAESDRNFYERMRAEDRRPRPIVVYQPRREIASPVFIPSYDTPQRLAPRWDPNLPDSQPPTLERRYYYDGR